MEAMALIGTIVAAAGRVFGRVANMAIGWATILLFGQVPQDKQTLLTIVTLGSLGWVAALVGVLVPVLGNFLLTAIPRPEFVQEEWLRLAMVAVAIVLPLVIGAVTLMLVPADQRPRGPAAVVEVLRGYPYAAILAITLVFLGAVALLRKVRSLTRRWEDAHVALLVRPGGYERVLRDLEAALDEAGLDVHRERAPRALSIPPRLLAAVGGRGVRGLVPDDLAQLKREDLEVLVYPSDLAMMGAKPQLARGRAALASRLTFTEAYLTAAKESQDIEDRLRQLRKGQPTRRDFQRIDERLAKLVVPHEEWETLYRLRLQIENERRLGGTSRPGAGDDPRRAHGHAAADVSADGLEGQGATPLSWAGAGALMLLLGIDIALALYDRRSGPASRSS